MDKYNREKIECGRWRVGREGESNGGKMGITEIEQQLKNVFKDINKSTKQSVSYKITDQK